MEMRLCRPTNDVGRHGCRATVLILRDVLDASGVPEQCKALLWECKTVVYVSGVLHLVAQALRGEMWCSCVGICDCLCMLFDKTRARLCQVAGECHG
ncbi:hypothetical protein BDW22DRAFT_1227473 [Trametopsis cervina]|nr:hypothetical protein BDW22DRAFT_1227473 [Trametopsis cervina]